MKFFLPKMMLGLGLGASLVAACSPIAIAQAPAAAPAAGAVVPVDKQPTREQLTRLFTAMRLQQQMDAFVKRVPQMIQQQIKAQTRQMADSMPSGSTMTPEQQAAVDKITAEYMQKAMDVLTIRQVMDDMIPIYQRHLTAVDVDAYIAFYQSPPGQHLLDQQPAIMEEYLPIAMKQAQANSKKLTDDLIRDLTTTLKATPAQSAPPKQ